jgi:hypothetical protein
MEELERFKKEISLMEYAPIYDYTELDRSQSSRTCVVLRRQADDGKIGVSRGHDGHWVYYDFRRGKGGSILDFVMQHTGCNLGQTRKELRKMLCCNVNSFSHTALLPNPRSATKNRQKVAWEYADTAPIARYHDYLENRGIGLESILASRFANAVRVDRYRNACFPYFDFEGIAGIEKRNHNFKCYTKGGRKGLWRSTLKEGDVRAVICEAPIDALSYAKLRNDKNDRTRYFAIGGQVSHFQWELIDGLIKKYSSEKMDIFLAFDNDPAGKNYIQQFQERYSGVIFTLDFPPQEGQDWNDVLQSNQSMKMKATA